MNTYNTELYHFGVKGMRWGVRRYADKKGRLNAAGRKKYGVKTVGEWKSKKAKMKAKRSKLEERAEKKYETKKYESQKFMEDEINAMRSDRHKKMFGTDAGMKKATYYSDLYNESNKKAHNYVERNMNKEFGKASYDQLKRQEGYQTLAVTGLAFAVSLGLVIADTKTRR